MYGCVLCVMWMCVCICDHSNRFHSYELLFTFNHWISVRILPLSVSPRCIGNVCSNFFRKPLKRFICTCVLVGVSDIGDTSLHTTVNVNEVQRSSPYEWNLTEWIVIDTIFSLLSSWISFDIDSFQYDERLNIENWNENNKKWNTKGKLCFIFSSTWSMLPTEI